MLASAEIGIAENLFERAGGEVFLPVLTVFRRHHNIRRPGPPSPPVQILPLKQAIDRSPQVEGERVALDAEKEHLRGRRGDFANGAGKGALFSTRFDFR